MKEISSAENHAVKLIKKLAQKKYREETGLFIIEGLRACELAATSPFQIDSFWLSESFLAQNHQCNPFWQSFPCTCIPDKIFASCTDTQSPQGILCLAKIPHSFTNPSGHCYLYLDNVRDPGNIGTMIRSADALGFDGIFLSAGCADLYSPKVIRSAMGSLFSIETVTDCSHSTLIDLQQKGYQIIASALRDDSLNLYHAHWNEKIIFVLGNEANGVSHEIIEMADMTVKIPMHGSAESFNVSIAAALMMGEVTRRKYEEH